MRSASVAALRAAGIAPEVLNRLDRVFVFKQLEGLDVARVAALEIEAMIRSYDLTIVDGGIDAEVLFGLMVRQERLGSAASARDLVRTIEQQISDSLILAKQGGFSPSVWLGQMTGRCTRFLQHDGTGPALVPSAGVAGDWVTVAGIGSTVPPPDGRPVNQAIRAQIVRRRVSAIMTLTAIGLPTSPALGFQIIPGCADAGLTFNRIIAAEPWGEQACWSMGPEVMAWNNLHAQLQASAAAELEQRADTVPQIGLHTVFIRANRSHGLKIELFQAIDTPPEGPAGCDHAHITTMPDRMARLVRLSEWVGLWWPLVERGFAGQLQAAEITAKIAHLPS